MTPDKPRREAAPGDNQVRLRLLREDIAEIISDSTTDDGHGNWIRTVIWRTNERTAPAGFEGASVPYTETRWMVFINGDPQASGSTDPEWGDEIDD